VETQFEDWRNGNETRPQSPPFVTICMPSFGECPAQETKRSVNRNRLRSMVGVFDYHAKLESSALF
jgi:hypothetical protein